MAQPRYNDALQAFIRDWHPNDPELDKRFIEAVRGLLAAVLKPPMNVFEVETILCPAGGKVIVRLADYEAQLQPLDAQHLALALIEAATAARTESWLMEFMQTDLGLGAEDGARMISAFRNYRIEEIQREVSGDFKRRSEPVEGKP